MKKLLLACTTALLLASCIDKSVTADEENASSVEVYSGHNIAAYKIKVDSVEYIIVKDWGSGGVAITRHLK